MRLDERVDSTTVVRPTFQSEGGGSIPASTLHYWFNETEEATGLVERFHYSRSWPAAVQLVVTAHESGGLFGNKGPAIAASVFTIPPTRWSVDVWELARLVRKDGLRMPLSALISASIRKLKRMDTPQLIVSFADWTQQHHGGIYQACGWNYSGIRAKQMDGVIQNGVFIPGRSANHKWGTRSPKKLAERGIAVDAHYDEGKHLYWLAWGEGIQTAEKLRLLRLPYPKPNEVTR